MISLGVVFITDSWGWDRHLSGGWCEKQFLQLKPREINVSMPRLLSNLLPVVVMGSSMLGTPLTSQTPAKLVPQ